VTGVQVPVGVGDDGLHELVRDSNRVVGVLVLDRVDVLTVEVHVQSRCASTRALFSSIGYTEEGIIFKGGSGAGVHLSKIFRAEMLEGGGTASGPSRSCAALTPAGTSSRRKTRRAEDGDLDRPPT